MKLDKVFATDKFARVVVCVVSCEDRVTRVSSVIGEGSDH
jgi:hypothetical protein